jgi:hypothetical protein
VSGAHQAGRTNANVNALNVGRELQLARLPGNIANFFPNLFALNWYDSALTAISPADLAAFPNLRSLALFGNRFVELEGNLLQSTPALRFIEFSSNRIEIVGENFLENLPALQQVSFLRNVCIDSSARTLGAIDQLKTLLAKQCAPIVVTTTEEITTVDECPEDIISRIRELQTEIDELRQGLGEDCDLS